ncbi:hypothetical protein D623_10011424 [Myotis brandtii]|uniref:Uncharacterized protein n=1 Tax=Myotis brandtii TaxID=109478 RepID=S7MS32_MYOBR|nr:hypothetical protein D623_10011424 [Myotis brandtii]
MSQAPHLSPNTHTPPPTCSSCVVRLPMRPPPHPGPSRCSPPVYPPSACSSPTFLPSLQLHCGFFQEAKHVVLPSQALRAPGRPRGAQHAFRNDAIFLPEDLGPGTQQSPWHRTEWRGAVRGQRAFSNDAIFLPEDLGPGTQQSPWHRTEWRGAVGGTGLLVKKCGVWESQVAWVNPDTPRCIGCCSPFQE